MNFASKKFAAGGLFLVSLSTHYLLAQGAPPAPTPPATAPQYAQTDISGDWSLKIHEDDRYRNPGAEIGEYVGIPINEAGQLKYRTWDASLNTLPERQCLPLPA